MRCTMSLLLVAIQEAFAIEMSPISSACTLLLLFKCLASDAATSLSRSGYGRFRRPFGRSPITRFPSGRSPAEIASYPIASSATAAAEAKLAVFDTVRRRRKRLADAAWVQSVRFPPPPRTGFAPSCPAFWSLARLFRTVFYFCSSGLVGTVPSYR